MAGYICKKLSLDHKIDPDPSSWISVVGEGRLVQPSDQLCSLVAKCDAMFDEFHGKGVRLCHDPLGKLPKFIIKKYPDFPPRVVDLFCKVKYFGRLKKLNLKIKLKNVNKSVRSWKQNAQFIN